MGNQEDLNPTYTVLRYQGKDLPKQYFNFILSKWMRSYRYGNDYIRLTDSDSYFAAYNHFLNRLLASPDTVVRLAVLTDDTDVALGFSVMRNRTLDYVHVQKDFRRQGIARKLVPGYIDMFTHLTRVGAKLWPTKLPDAKFNPFA